MNLGLFNDFSILIKLFVDFNHFFEELKSHLINIQKNYKKNFVTRTSTSKRILNAFCICHGNKPALQ